MFLSDYSRPNWDPFADMRRMQNEMNRLFSELGRGRTAQQAFPPVNLWVGQDSVVVTAEIPGVARDDLKLTVQENTVVIQGKRTAPETGDNYAWHRRERGYGEFARTVDLPFRVDPDKVKARTRHGVLELELNRPEAEKPRKIRINAA
jgi:HSP20 family protein